MTNVSHFSFLNISINLHIALSVVDFVKKALWRHPLHWETSICRLSVVVLAVNVTRQTKISDLHDEVVADENVSRCQIAMTKKTIH